MRRSGEAGRHGATDGARPTDGQGTPFRPLIPGGSRPQPHRTVALAPRPTHDPSDVGVRQRRNDSVGHEVDDQVSDQLGLLVLEEVTRFFDELDSRPAGNTPSTSLVIELGMHVSSTPCR